MRAAIVPALVAILGIAVFGAVWVAADIERVMHTALPVPEEGGLLFVERGDAFREVTEKLARETRFEHPLHLQAYARWHGFDRRVRAGEYRIAPGTTPARLLGMMVRGEVVQHSITLIEGWTWRRALAAIQAHPKVVATLDRASPEMGQEVARKLELPSPEPEGWFLPDTYRFIRGTTDIELLERAHRALREWLDEAWHARDRAIPLETPYEALILASIVEKETGVPEERARVAGVFARRLERGMRLDADPTVLYGLRQESWRKGGEGDIHSGRELTTRDLERDTPYNTYRRHGLPPTPIALPGVAALEAALRPAKGDELYFVATGEEGRHVFSRTYREHRAAVRAWRQHQRQAKKREEEGAAAARATAGKGGQ